MPKPPFQIHTPAEAFNQVVEAKRVGRSVGLVPTMGALHEGHLSLVRRSQAECDMTVATIFVNPTQFAPHEDLAKYPKPLENDLAALSELGVDFVFLPTKQAMYPQGFSTYVEPPAVSRRLEGERRPDHFRGVATIVLKLFNILPADAAFFGEKDFQQLLVIRKMVEDFNLPITVWRCPIVRDADGLALSSRNTYLSPSERERGLSLSRSLLAVEKMVLAGEQDAGVLRERMRNTLIDGGVTDIDYVALANPETLEEVDRIAAPFQALIAARVGQTRLIDNRRIEPPGA